jgi:MFS superfamily sulfate permease-like transporter
VVLGGGSILLLVGRRRLSPSIPGALVAVATATGLVWAFGLHKHGVNIVGSVPGGLLASSLSPPGGETL